MSLILDALKKADRDRSDAVDSPSIDSTHKTPSPEPSGFVIKPIHGVIAVVVILFIISLAFIFGKSSVGNSAIEQHQAPLTNQPSKTQIKSAPQITSKYSDFKKNIQDKKIALEYQSAQSSPSPITAAKQSNIGSNPQTQKTIITAQTNNTVTDTPKSTQSVAGIYDNSSIKNEKVEKNEISSTSTDLESGNSIDDYPELGGIRDLPWSTQDKIPSMTYAAHDYSSVNATVTINKSVFRQGSRVDENLYIEKILEDGIILKYGEYRFKMQALSSWVNFQ